LEPIALPIAVGTASISLSVDLAASLPAQLASTTTHVTATSSDGQGMVCMDVYLKDASSSNALKSAGNPWDEIVKLVCQELENGSTEPEAEKYICAKLSNSLEIAGCDKLVEYAWSTVTKSDCPSLLSRAVPAIV